MNKQKLLIEDYLFNLNEIDLSSAINSISGNNIKRIAIDIKLALKGNNIKKIKEIFKIVPKVEFNKIESFANKKINNFKSLYSISKKIATKELNTSEDKIKIGSAVLALAASVDKNPQKKLKKYLNDIIIKTRKNISGIEELEVSDFFTKNTISVALASLATLIIGIPLSAIPVIGLPLIIIVFIGSFIASIGLFNE